MTQTNRLAKEASAYLQQHQHNPVDWYPWGDEALAKAKAEDKPIFLSIGYSACHWCHVMEKESFENEATAMRLNTGFVCIKVDREERPDLDQLYQTTVQLMGRSGGWPLSVFLVPDGRPFFAGTYFPPERKFGMPGFSEVLDTIRDAYDQKREDIELQANELTQAIQTTMDVARNDGDQSPGPDLLVRVADKLGARFDDEHGGFGGAPKFPNSMNLDLLLRHSMLHRDTTSESRVRRALWAMRAGGLWDQLGGGFHRYSTDEKWLVPHFEKMLYDNALLLRLYADAYLAFGDTAHKTVATDIVAYAKRELTSSGGAFYATQDADSEGSEGKFFVWTVDQVGKAVESPLDAEVARLHFGVTEDGNFEHAGSTVLSEAVPLERIALRMGKPPSEIEAALARAKTAMFLAREERVKPFRDEKLLATWNGLFIASLAHAGGSLGLSSMVIDAERAYAHVKTQVVRDGRVSRFFTERGEKRELGFLDDHANLGNAAFELYETTGKPNYADDARAMAEEILAHFWDKERQVFFLARAGGEALIARTEDPYDQATPSGASMAAQLFLRLGSLGHSHLREAAIAYLVQMAGGAIKNPFAFGQTLAVLSRLVLGSVDVVVCGPLGNELTLAALSSYLPNRTVVQIDPTNPDSVRVAGPLADGKGDGGPSGSVAFVCRGNTCSLPVTTVADLRSLLSLQTHAH